VPVENVDLARRKKLVVVLLVEANPDNSGVVVSNSWKSARQVSSREKSAPKVARILVPFVEIQVEEVARQVLVIWWRARVRIGKVEIAEPIKFSVQSLDK